MITIISISSPLDDLFEGVEIDSDRKLAELAAHEIIHALGEYSILNLAYDGEQGRNPGYLFRGETEFSCLSLQPSELSVEESGHCELVGAESSLFAGRFQLEAERRGRASTETNPHTTHSRSGLEGISAR